MAIKKDIVLQHEIIVEIGEDVGIAQVTVVCPGGAKKFNKVVTGLVEPNEEQIRTSVGVICACVGFGISSALKPD